MKLPWDAPAQPERITREEKERRQSKRGESERKSARSRQPRRTQQSFDLYSPTQEKDGNEGEGRARSSIKAPKQSNSPNAKSKLGILLIDHGSKKQSSNDALHSIADKYETALSERLENAAAATDNTLATVVVRASHMEIATPSILTGLKSLLTKDDVTKIVCVPYFLGGGRHVVNDIPTLIEDAKDELDEEGLLDIDGGRVEIVMSNHLGSDVDSMLEVVNDLVGDTLKEDGDENFLWISSSSESSSDQDGAGIDTDATENELRKYTNRATLLEDMLEKKVQQLRTMTNRVTILEDVLNKKLEENDMLKRRNAGAGGATKRVNEVKSDESKKVANLTDTVDALVGEKEQIMKQLQSLEAQKINMEDAHNVAVSELLEKVSLLEGEVEKQNETNASLKKELLEKEKATERQQEENQNQKVQEQKIMELQSQLADMLDAYNELEQLQNETEASVNRYRDQLNDAKRENERLVQSEQSKAERYSLECNESQSLLQEERVKYKEMLEEGKKEYEESLAREKATAKEWKDKYDALSAELEQKLDASSARPEEEWSRLQDELQGALRANTDATNKIQALEKELEELQKSQELSTSKEAEQQQQLQEYLKAQIQTYYETIQDQTAEISSYKKQIEDMQSNHDDSMLIATNSVEASQRRETDLLNNIEELESELNLLQEEKNHRDEKLRNLQKQLDEGAIDMISNSAIENEALHKQNKQLVAEIDELRRQVDTLAEEKQMILKEKEKIERAMINSIIGEDSKPDKLLSKAKPKQSRWRYLLRPWALFKRQS